MNDFGELLQTPKIIALTNEEKELYSKLNFNYFLEQNCKSENISSENLALIHKGYKATVKKISTARDVNSDQFHLFMEGYVRKMHSSGMLAAHFNLSESRPFRTNRYEDYGENWAYFEEWSKKEKTIRLRKIIWKRIVEAGALIGFLLGIIHLYEIFSVLHK